MLYAIKTILATVVALCLSVTSFIGNVIISEEVMAEFYVSTTGSDENTGSYDKPFLTIEKAQQEVRKTNGNMMKMEIQY